MDGDAINGYGIFMWELFLISIMYIYIYIYIYIYMGNIYVWEINIFIINIWEIFNFQSYIIHYYSGTDCIPANKPTLMRTNQFCLALCSHKPMWGPKSLAKLVDITPRNAGFMADFLK